MSFAETAQTAQLQQEVDEMRTMVSRMKQQQEEQQAELKRQREESDRKQAEAEQRMWSMLEAQSHEHSKQMSQRRHTGSKSSGWHEKKRARAEAHMGAQASGGSASSAGARGAPTSACQK